ncbi:regulatory protein RecX [Petralouisia muris]|jgi:regulatory protein|uniref:Regulatory protein RecX n=1 Tax=Petralouisia muris TaxID=3032872 RepID=A0AC61RU82_9FIRM|nr:RecX family transcriptional regulator [Petralouisia muris]TGY95435.1 regulatory protein RecX [Petralouisia muris]
MQIVQMIGLDKKRTRVILEDGRSFVLYRGEVRRYSLEEQQELTEEQYEEIRSEVLIKRARRRTMHLLEKMDRTEAQLREKLRQGFYPEDVIEDAVAYVKGYHYLDDGRYARNYVRNQKEKKSRRKLQSELMGKGIGKELAEQALEEEYQQVNEQELILKWVEKKHYSSETADLKEKQKMYQFLMRKGFHSDDILHVLDHLT